MIWRKKCLAVNFSFFHTVILRKLQKGIVLLISWKNSVELHWRIKYESDDDLLMKCYTNFKKHHSTIQKKSTLVRLQEIFLRLYTCAKCSRWVRFFTNFNIFLKKKKKKSTHFSSKYQKCFNFGNIRKAELKTWTISLCKYIFFFGKRINYWNDIAFLPNTQK